MIAVPHLAPFEDQVFSLCGMTLQKDPFRRIDALHILRQGRDLWGFDWASDERPIDAAFGRLRRKGLVIRYQTSSLHGWGYWYPTQLAREILGLP